MERRRHVRHPPEIGRAFIYIERNVPLIDCEVLNISDGGARVHAHTGMTLPTHFLLFFDRDGDARRSCRIVWRDGTNVGVAFED